MKFKKLLSGLLLAAVASLNLAALAVPTAVTPVLVATPVAPVTATARDMAWVVCDAVNGNSVTLTGREIVLLWNSGGSPYTVTFTSVAAANGRTGDITSYSIGAGLYSQFGPFPLDGWLQSSDGTLRFTASNALVKYIVLRLPSIQ